MTGIPLHRFEEYGRLTPSEKDYLIGIADPPRGVRKGYQIQREGVEVTGFFLLLSGWAAAALTLRNGSRQIVKIHLPGDALGTPGMAMRRTTEELVALTDVEVAHISLANFGSLFERHPRIIARFMLSIQQERIALMDRLVSIGKTSGECRMAAFLLDLRNRLEPLGFVKDGSFDMLITQEDIGDVLGLTAVHINRMLKALTASGLLKRTGKRFSLINVEALMQLAAVSLRQPFPDQPWLPLTR